jgi:alkylation response protein AidB-like acyl-CoA dehydrogenase
MDLDFTEEQDMLRNLVRSLVDDVTPLTVVRELEDDPVGYSTELWAQLAELDLIGLTLPEEYGGSGMSMIEGAIVYEELGRGLAPTPHFVSAVLGAGIVLRLGTTEQRQAILPGVATGETILSPAWLEPDGSFAAKGVRVRAVPDGDGFVIDGVKRHVAFASSAQQLVVLARTGDAETDIGIFLVDRDADGVSLEQSFTIASDTQYEVTFTGVRVGADAVVGGAAAATAGWDAWVDTMLDGAILLAASAVGGAQFSLDITNQYAKDREQFDKPLGAFQAIAHYLADAKTAIDGATLLAREAAWARAESRDVSRLAPMAKLFACQTFRDTTAMAQQVFGGVGFTLEYDIQLYFRRAKQLQLSWWNDRELEERIAASVLDRDPAPV